MESINTAQPGDEEHQPPQKRIRITPKRLEQQALKNSVKDKVREPSADEDNNTVVSAGSAWIHDDVTFTTLVFDNADDKGEVQAPIILIEDPLPITRPPLYTILNYAGFNTQAQQFLKACSMYYEMHRNKFGSWNGSYTSPCDWDAGTKEWFKKRMINAIPKRIKDIEYRKGNCWNRKSQKEKGWISADKTLEILQLDNWDQVYTWWSLLMPPNMHMHMMYCLYAPKTTFIDIGHVIGVSDYDIEGDENWYLRAFHHSNLGPQFSVVNKIYQKEKILYPRKWDKNAGMYVRDDKDNRDREEKLEVFKRDEKALYDAMKAIREKYFGSDSFDDSIDSKHLYEQKWRINVRDLSRVLDV